MKRDTTSGKIEAVPDPARFADSGWRWAVAIYW